MATTTLTFTLKRETLYNEKVKNAIVMLEKLIENVEAEQILQDADNEYSNQNQAQNIDVSSIMDSIRGGISVANDVVNSPVANNLIPFLSSFLNQQQSRQTQPQQFSQQTQPTFNQPTFGQQSSVQQPPVQQFASQSPQQALELINILNQMGMRGINK